MEYARLRGEAGSDISLADLGFQTDLRVYLHLRQTWMAFSESQSHQCCPQRGLGGSGEPRQLEDSPPSEPPPCLRPLVIILSILELIIILLLIFLRKRIVIAIALIKEASRWVQDAKGSGWGGPRAAWALILVPLLLPRAVGYVMCSILYPLVTFFLLCLCIAYWASTAVYPPSHPDCWPWGWLRAKLAWK